VERADQLLIDTEPGTGRVGLARSLARAPLLSVVARRLILAVPLLFIVSVLSFVLVSVSPGDPAQTISGSDYTSVSHADYVRLRHSLGLDQPLYERYWHWLAHAARGDLGASLYSAQPVTTSIDARLPVTLSLIGGALLVITLIGVGLGLVSAVRGGLLGRFVDGLALVGFALPAFWVGAVLIAIFAVDLHWLPATGYVSFADSPRSWFLSLILPVAALAVHSVAAVAKQTREAMLDALGSEYTRMAWARGVSAASIFLRHALKHAAMRVTTVMGLIIVGLLAGTVFVETVFALPGLGTQVVQATIQHDLPVIQGVVVYFTVIVVLVNLATDVAYTFLDPRVRAR
jgi:peptide/nickel transport system permease protein